MLSQSVGTTFTHACECWQLAPEGAAIHPGERTAVIADVHLGYEWARGSAGDCVPAHSLDETLSRLDRLLARAPIARLIVAGDLIESPRPCRRTAADLDRLRGWLDSLGVSLLALEGNHDRSPRRVSRPTRGSTKSPPLPASCTVDGWTIGHGHRPLSGPRIISGHHHPVLRFERNIAPCFLVGPSRIVLPAFSSNAAGGDVLTEAVPDDWHTSQLRCIVSTGNELLDFGPLPDLQCRLRGILY
jgi:putative SbcD/Mre11-related phosphoesterase